METLGSNPKKASKNEAETIVNPNTQIAAELLTHLNDSLESRGILDIYEKNDTKVETLRFDINEPSARVLHMSELLLGHQDSAVDFYINTIDKIAGMPKELQPHIVVLSGFMQGDFKYLEKSRRSTLVQGLTKMDTQFKYAKEMIEYAQIMKVPVVYNISNDDRRISEEYTVEVFRRMQDHARSKKDGVNWAKMDKMRQNPEWHTHAQFQIETVFPYCLRSGRRLYTADEMKEKTDGLIDIEEYYVLFKHHEAMKTGAAIDPRFSDWMQRSAQEQNQDIIVTNDFDMEISTNNREYSDSVRHYMNFSPTPMYQNHMKTSLEALAQQASHDKRVPDMLITQHNQEAVGVGNQGSWVVSNGGLFRPRNFVDANGSRTDARGDVSRRIVTTRRRIPEPTATMHERTDDGRHIVTFFNDTLNEKSYSLPERMSIAELCDFQTGSITARPDILAKYLDYIRTRVIGERATALFFGGDMIHGRNYPHFPSESQMTGLMAMDSQESFNTDLFKTSFSDVSKQELAALERVLVQPGNHEWNSGTLKWHGYSFTTYMRNVFERMYARAGYTDEEIAERVKSHEAFITQKGEYASGYVGVEQFGDIGVLIQHYLLERGGKGSGGDLPVYQAHHFANGSSDVLKNVDIHMAGHWHHPQYGLFGDKLGIVGGSIAGISDYELKRGYRPTISGTVMHIGGGLPTQVEFISEQALHAHEISTGGFSPAVLRAEGYTNDREFDPIRHGIFLPDQFAKSALQKKLLAMMRSSSQRADKIAEFR